MIPLSIVFITYNININFDDFAKTILCLLILISGTIVITNIFEVSLNSYTNEVIKANIFEWFTGAYDKYNYSSLASKGIFNFANQIAAVLVLLLPIGLAIYTYKKTILNLVSII
ncbi:O-antigen ligase family protein, partial [Paraclostridium sordellii]